MGGIGGKCFCPDGQDYFVGQVLSTPETRTLACEGGTSGEIVKNQVIVDSPESGKHGGDCLCPDGDLYEAGVLLGSPEKLNCVNGSSGEVKKRNGDWSKKKVVCARISNSAVTCKSIQECSEPTLSRNLENCVEPENGNHVGCGTGAGVSPCNCKMCKEGFVLDSTGVCIPGLCIFDAEYRHNNSPYLTPITCHMCTDKICQVCKENYSKDKLTHTCVLSDVEPVNKIDHCKYHMLEVAPMCYQCKKGFVVSADQLTCVKLEDEKLENLGKCRILGDATGLICGEC